MNSQWVQSFPKTYFPNSLISFNNSRLWNISLIKFKMWVALFYVNYQSYFQVKIVVVVVLRLYLQFFCRFTKRYFDFWMLVLMDFSIFPNSGKRWESGFFYISLGFTSKFLGYFWSPLDFILCQIVWIDFQAQYFCRGPNLWLNCQLSRKWNVHVYMTI